MILLTDIVSFILRHRRNKVFKSWEPWQIEIVISGAIERNSIYVDLSPVTGLIRGVVIGSPDFVARTIHIDQILSVSHRTTMRNFGQWFHENYKGFSMTAIRRGKNVTYGDKTERLIQKLTA